MKVVNRPVDAVVVFMGRYKPRPCRLRYQNRDGKEVVIRIGKILSVERNEKPGVLHKYIHYDCQGDVDGVDKRFELKYYIDTARWEIHKI